MRRRAAQGAGQAGQRGVAGASALGAGEEEEGTMIDKTVRKVLEAAFVAWVERERLRRGDACATEAEVATIKTDPLAFDRMLQGADAWEFYRFVCEAADPLRLAAADFPERFGLRAFPGQEFRISPCHSYMDGQTVMLYTEVWANGRWESFCKGTPEELRREVKELKES